MAFNRKYFKLFQYLLPKSKAFNIVIQKWITKLFEGLTALPDDFRTYIDEIFLDIFPDYTRSIELWEEQFGMRMPSSDMAMRRNDVDIRWKLKGGQSAYYLQSILQEAGFDLQVHENNPKIDPDIFISANYVMTCGNSWAVCGNDDAYAGRTGGYILANGFIADTIALRDYLMVCGFDGVDNITCGQQEAVCGYFNEFIVNARVYSIPNDSDYWDYVFFIGGNATRDPLTHELTAIEMITIDSTRQAELEALILKIKPVHTWAGMMVQYS